MTNEQIEELRQKAIKNTMNKFNWSKKRYEMALGSNVVEFLWKVKLVNKEEMEVV